MIGLSMNRAMLIKMRKAAVFNSAAGSLDRTVTQIGLSTAMNTQESAKGT